MGNVRYNFYDVFGHHSARRTWHEYIQSPDAVVFLIDASHPERFDEAKAELDKLIRMPEL